MNDQEADFLMVPPFAIYKLPVKKEKVKTTKSIKSVQQKIVLVKQIIETMNKTVIHNNGK